MEVKTLFSAKTLSKRWDMSRTTIWRRVREGKLNQPKEFGNLRRWTLEDVKAFEHGQTSTPKS